MNTIEQTTDEHGNIKLTRGPWRVMLNPNVSGGRYMACAFAGVENGASALPTFGGKSWATRENAIKAATRWLESKSV